MSADTKPTTDRQILGFALWAFLAPAWRLAELFGRNIHEDETEEDR